MSLILSALVSFLVSLSTCFVFFLIFKKKNAEEKNEQTIQPVAQSQNVKPEARPESKSEAITYVTAPNAPIKEFTFDNFFIEDETFIEKMKSMLNNYWINNPLILRGPTGSGKTHFMRALENNLLEKNPSMKVCFISAEAFTNEFVDSIKNKTISDFREKYRNLDALFVDDFNYLSHKTSTQDELFYTISELLRKKAFISFGLTTPCSLKEGFSDRLISLIKSIQIDMPTPGFDAKRKKIMETFEKVNCFINGDLVDYLAKPDIGLNELVGICQKIILVKDLEGKGCVNLKIDEIKPLLD